MKVLKVLSDKVDCCVLELFYSTQLNSKLLKRFLIKSLCKLIKTLLFLKSFVVKSPVCVCTDLVMNRTRLTEMAAQKVAQVWG